MLSRECSCPLQLPAHPPSCLPTVVPPALHPLCLCRKMRGGWSGCAAMRPSRAPPASRRGMPTSCPLTLRPQSLAASRQRCWTRRAAAAAPPSRAWTTCCPPPPTGSRVGGQVDGWVLRRQWQLATLAGKTARHPGQCLNYPYLAGPAWHRTCSTLHRCPLPPSPSTHPPGEEAIAYSDERVEALAQFQASCIRHALRFPALRRLVYSTCRCALGMLGTL